MPHKIDFAVGGQAVIEGVMMRSPKFIAVAVRKADKSIFVQSKPFKSLSDIATFLKWPILRGMLGLIEMMIVGLSALNFSARENFSHEKNAKQPNSNFQKSPLIEGIFFAFTLLFSLSFALFLFKFLPLLLTQFLSTIFEVLSRHYIVFNIVDGGLKISFFIIYIAFISMFPDIRRVFEYHGAEHKAVFNYEKNIPLTVANAKKQSRFHPRCGTSFILVVFIISIFIYTLLPKQPNLGVQFFQRVAFLPLIAGISYEFLRFSARYRNHVLVRIFVIPGLLLQRLTTREPDDSQLEVSLKALAATLELEKHQVS
ncbi:DUF1385 domain-containing protein [Candidatus Peregrinibacteria bacterium]|nr:DUF1385 domain-containing protein [Candidatus Peregrinibacteria bacterium]